MRIVAAIALCLAPCVAFAGQTIERKGGSIIMYDYDYPASLDSCAVSGGSGDAALSGQLTVRVRSDQRVSGRASFDVDIASSPGMAPTVSAHAINTKGTGATNNGRVVVQTCAARTATVARRGLATGVAAGSCTISDSPDTMTVSFVIPLSAFDNAKTGHVTLIKRGESMDGATVAASCTADKPMLASWDLATLKK